MQKNPDRKLDSIDFTPSGWNRRHKEFQSKIQSGTLVDLMKIFRDLMYVAQQKDLSFGERTILQTIEDLIAQEIQTIKGDSRESVIQMLRSPF